MAGAGGSQRPRSATELKELLEVERLGRPFLFYREPNGRQRVFDLGSASGGITIGRSGDADVALGWDDQVSRLHAELQPIGRDWTIVDDRLSTNGTYVNGRRISGRRPLADRDCLRVGNTLLTFRHPTQRSLPQTVRPGELRTLDTLTPAQQRVLAALCRPCTESAGLGAPATNRQIAEEVHLSVDTVKTHLRILYQRFELDDLVQNQKRATLAEVALEWGLVPTAGSPAQP